MSAYLVVFILFSGELLRSSASFLTTTKLSEELSATNSLTASAIGPPVTSLETLLSGYVTIVYHSDDSCTSQTYVLNTALNVCITNSDDEYEYYTATSSSVTTARYTDSLCTEVSVLASSYTESYVTGACDNKRKVFVGSAIAPNPSTATVQTR